jgi:aldehyde dehydrogenase (NAD+)
MDIDRPFLFINGSFVPSSGGEPIELLEAATELPLGTSASATKADLDRAVAAARAAFPYWRGLGAEQRGPLLARFADALRSRGPQTAELVSRENGMPMRLSSVANGRTPAAIIAYYATLASETSQEEIRANAVGHTIVRREPVGVVAVITPWNFPQALAAMKIAPALASGCTVVFKASPETALDAFAFADAAVEAGLPEGVVNIVPGGREEGAYLVSHPDVDKVAFTGSTAAGRTIGEVCGRLLRPVSLELGGKSAAVVLDDVDLDAMTQNLYTASFANNGQTCFLSSRILAPESRYADVVDAVSGFASRLRVGNPLESSTEIGPLVSAGHRARVLGYIQQGLNSRARLTAGGGVPADKPVGFFVEPTVFADVDNGDMIAREEIFGPVLAVIKYRSVDEAVRIANDNEFGLGGTVWSADEARATDVARQLETGTVGVNDYALDLRSPFGGVKSSGLGRDLGPEALAGYQHLKSIYRFDKAS